MKNIKNIYRKLILVSALISGMFITSCDDYLTIIPPEKLVHEDFWRTEAEVTGYSATAYATLCNNNTLTRAIIWGESRAQSIDCKAQSNENLENLFNGLLYDDNSYATWSEYYNAISACNLVMEYGPNVTTKDPNFSNAEMVIIEGEMLALRAYAHFMLLRAFCNIPLATKVVMSDSDIPSYPQEEPMTVLNSIYSDLESASTKVLLSSAPSSTSLGRITTNAVYALMADVNMWRAAFAKYYELSGSNEYSSNVYYEMAIDNCRKILGSMYEIYCEEVEKEEDRTPYGLLENDNDKKEGDKDPRKYGFSRAYNKIFGDGNSLESIFEFQITKNNFGKSSGIASLYGANGDKNAPLFVAKRFVEEYFDDKDLRKYAFTSYPNSNRSGTNDKEEVYINKYHYKTTPTTAEDKPQHRTSDDYDANWIMYRKTDVMLMLAEALIQCYGDGGVAEAFDIVQAINARWMMDGVCTLQYTTTAKECLKLVRQERARELCFEGKLWFDIVREALQTPHEERGQLVVGYNTKINHGADNEELVMRSTRISSLFMPIHKEEMRFNEELVQNESCISSGSDEYINQN